jgi:hypothetical protein
VRSGRLDEVIADNALPERVADELFDASIGFRLRRSGYVRRAGIDQRTASRDLYRLTELGLLRGVGQTRGRHYVAGQALIALRHRVVEQRVPISDPYPWMPQRLAEADAEPGAHLFRAVAPDVAREPKAGA